MKKNRSRFGPAVVLLVWAACILVPSAGQANLKMQKKAKELGFPAETCLYCHNEKLPKKDTVTHNDRGKWLIAEKEKRGAKEFDPAWLKDYPGDKK